jgi:hypothetical protein
MSIQGTLAESSTGDFSSKFGVWSVEPTPGEILEQQSFNGSPFVGENE